MRLYHILPSGFALSNLRFRRLKVARIADLNDPFELLPFKFKAESEKLQFESDKKEWDSKHGLLCFSDDWMGPLLWSHYGDKHKGICLGFDVADDKAKKIDYIGERIDFRTLIDNPDLDRWVQQWLYSKFKYWEYEREWRAQANLGALSEEDGLYFASFDGGLILREVILGVRCLVSLDETKSLLQEIGTGISLAKSRLDDHDFRIVLDKSSIWES